MKKEIEEAKKLKIEAKDLLSNYEGRIGKSKKPTDVSRRKEPLIIV